MAEVHLNDEQKKAFELKAKGLSDETIAKKLGMGKASVKKMFDEITKGIR